MYLVIGKDRSNFSVHQEKMYYVMGYIGGIPVHTVDRRGIKPLSPTHTMWEKLNLDSPSESILSNLATLLMGKERPRITNQVPPSPCVSDGTFTLT